MNPNEALETLCIVAIIAGLVSAAMSFLWWIYSEKGEWGDKDDDQWPPIP